MNTKTNVWISCAGIAALVVLAGCGLPETPGEGGTVESLSQAERGAHDPGVAPPNSNPHGRSYGEWAVRWWQWAYSIPAVDNALFDETGEDCANGQSGSVWFLGGVFGASGSATRTRCVVPPGKALFFPILNYENDNIICVDPNTDFNAEQLRANVKVIMDGSTDLAAEVDGEPVNHLAEQYRFQSPVFSLRPVANGIADAFGCLPAPPVVSPVVDDGFYLMLEPLAPGKHTIHFHGTLPGFTLDVTYELTVAH